jgi:hypothetical protein
MSAGDSFSRTISQCETPNTKTVLRRKFVSSVDSHSNGVKNGPRIGIRLNIAANDAGVQSEANHLCPF